jgi:hypothetical protein
MNEPLISKTELITRLNEIYYQLEKLEDVLHSSFLQQQEYVHSVQADRISHCSSKLSSLENVINKQMVEKNCIKQSFTNQRKKGEQILGLNLV